MGKRHTRTNLFRDQISQTTFRAQARFTTSAGPLGLVLSCPLLSEILESIVKYGVLAAVCLIVEKRNGAVDADVPPL